MNVLDKVIGYFNPNKELQRQVARKQIEILNSGYSNYGASRTRKVSKGWNYSGGGPREDIDDNISILRQRSQDAFCGIPIATSAIKTMRTNVVGSGIKPRPNIDATFLGLSEDEAAEWERNTLREFSLWADSKECDLERLNNFYELQQLAFISWITRGDVFALLPYTERKNMPYSLRIQLIESDRVCNPTTIQLDRDKIINGVERNDKGEIVAYHIVNIHPLSSSSKKKEWKRVKAFGDETGRRNVLHCMDSERIGQSRGVPILSPVLEMLKQLGRYTDAELMAALVSSMFTTFVETTSGQDEKPWQDPDYEDEDEENELSMGNGTVVVLPEGKSVKFANPARNNSSFDEFINSLVRQIGAALEIPPELLLKQFTNNYSASRGALLEAWKMFKMRRSWLVADFCQPIYEEWLAEAVAKGRIYAPNFFNDPLIRKAYSNCTWSGPSAGQLDPVKEADAATIRVEQGFSTRQQESIEINGSDYFENIRQRVREERARKDLLQNNENSKGMEGKNEND